MTVVAGQLRRQRTLGEILGVALALYRKHFRTFFLISVAALPIGIAGAVARRSAFGALLSFVAIVVELIVVAAIAFAVANIADGYSPKTIACYRQAITLIGDLALACLCVFLAAGIIILVGAIIASLFIGLLFPWGLIPAAPVGLATLAVLAYFLVGWALFVPMVVIEEKSASNSLSSSSSLTKGARWRVLGILFVLWALQALVASPATAITWTVSRLVGPILGDIIGTFVLPFAAIAYTLLFFDLQSRERERVSVT
jgi:hypothetical protein